MATLAEYQKIEAELTTAFTAQEHQFVPGWEIPLIPPTVIPAMVKVAAKIAVDTLDADRAQRTSSGGS